MCIRDRRCPARGRHHAGFHPAGGLLSTAAPVRPSNFATYNLEEFDRGVTQWCCSRARQGMLAQAGRAGP
eukprot:10722277-Alexandrium_andersonii.AAC.1